MRLSRRKLLLATPSIIIAKPAAAAFTRFQASNPAVNSLPAGVTLQAIDGETMTGNTMSHNYYGGNSYSLATGTGWASGVKSWDDPTFIPILCDYSFNGGNAATDFFALGLNGSIRLTNGFGAFGSTNTVGCLNNGIWDIVQSGGEGGTPNSSTAGGHVEEPATQADIDSDFASFQSAGTLANRYMQLSIGSAPMFGGNIGGIDLPTTCSELRGTTGRHVDLLSIDVYWFSGANGAGSTDWFNMRNFYLTGGVNLTADQAARGSNYGDLVDGMRGILVAGGFPAPVFPYVENTNSLLTSPAEITPPQFNWAVWSTIIHGARMVVYFGQTGSYSSQFGFNPNILGGQSVSLNTQAVNTNGLVTNLAAILNSPFAIGYASVSPAGYNFPTGNQSGSPPYPNGGQFTFNSGIEVMTKWYQGGSYTPSSGPLSGVTLSNGFYIFADVRGSQTQTNISATFTVASGSSVTVLNESRSISISGGTFTDTFATAYTVHIYQVN